MKWYKHMTDASDEPFIQELILRFGSQGYHAWFGLLEVAAKQVRDDPDPDQKFEFSPTFLKQKFHISPRKLQEIFEFCSGKVRLFSNFSQENWKFQIPKLLELKDNYTKDLQATGKKLSHHKELRAKNKEKDIKRSQGSRLSTSPTGNGNVPEEIERIRIACGRYPKKNLWPSLKELVGNKTAEELTQKFNDWSLHGWNQTNYRGWIEYDPATSKGKKIGVGHVSDFKDGF